jgi:hypothetical protein
MDSDWRNHYCSIEVMLMSLDLEMLPDARVGREVEVKFTTYALSM